MGEITTVGKLLLKSNIPADLRHFIDSDSLDAKGITKFFEILAQRSPEIYKKTVTDLTRLGFEVSTRQGSSVGLSDLLSPVNKDIRFKEIDRKIHEIEQSKDARTVKDAKITDLYEKFTDLLNKDILEEGLKNNKTLAKVILSGSRGSPTQYRQTVAAPVLVNDATGKPMIDFSVRHSFAEGLTLPEYLAHSYGTRQGTVSTKLCCSGDTLVLMSDFSSKQIKDIKAGEYIIGTNKDGICSPVKVLNNFDNGVRECYKYTFRKNSSKTEVAEIIATPDHKVLSKIKLGHGVYKHLSVYTPTAIPLSKTSKGIYVAYPALQLEGFEGISEPRALLLGLILGDGCTRGANIEKNWLGQMQLSCADQLLLDDTKTYFIQHNYKLTQQSEGSYGHTLSFIKKLAKVKTGRYNSIGIPTVTTGCPIKQWFNDIGLMNCLAHDKTIPAEVWTWDNDSIAQLLSGIFSTDGSVYTRKRGKHVKGITISLHLTSKQMVEEVKKLLEYRFGIYGGSLEFVAKETKQFATHDLYGFKISHKQAIKLFAKYIPLVGVKRSKLVKYLEQLSDYHNNEEYGFQFIEKTLVGNVNTYDIEVDNKDHLFRLTNGLVISNSVADAGYFSKQLTRATMTMKVEEHDCGTDNGIEVTPDDHDSIGCYLAQPINTYKKNNEVTPSMLNSLREQKLNFIVRSPITCQSSRKFHSGAVCQLCVGKRERHGLPQIGDYVGITASTTLGERLSQGTLNKKHTSASAQKVQAASGFKLIDQLANIPKSFNNKAALAFKDGTVTNIKPAPQGGHYVYIDGEEYYIPTLSEVKVTKGQVVEAGDQLSDGIINPAEVVKLKGIGQGRKYFSEAMRKAFDDSGMKINRRNFELISKAAVDHVRLSDNAHLGDHLPGQIVSYQTIEKNYKPRTDSKTVRIDQAYNQYLEQPVLHYTIGTRITHRTIENLKRNKVESIIVNDKPPAFEPEMQRLLDVPAYEPDWMHQLYSTYLQKRFGDLVNTGAQSNLAGPSPVAGLAYGVGFGEKRMEKKSIDTEYVTENHILKVGTVGGEYGCLMAVLEPSDAKQLITWSQENVDGDSLTHHGLEHAPHVTVLYGFDEAFDYTELQPLLEAYKTISFTLGKVSRFNNKDKGFDVLKMDVESNDLQEINKAIQAKFKGKITNSYPEYKPHLTIAYVKPGTCKELDDHAAFESCTYIVKSLIYSFSGSKYKVDVPIGVPESKEKKAFVTDPWDSYDIVKELGPTIKPEEVYILSQLRQKTAEELELIKEYLSRPPEV